MTRIVNVHDAKTHLSRLLHDVEQGEEILIGRAGIPVARLSPVGRATRHLGSARGQLWVAADFDETPEEIIEDFYR